MVLSVCYRYTQYQNVLFFLNSAIMNTTNVLHEHCSQLQEVIVFWVLHLYNTPWVETTSDLLAFGFNQLVGANHREWNTGLEKKIR